MLSRGMVDYIAEELPKTSCLRGVKIFSMISLETSSWLSRKPFLMLIISLNCASNLMCHLRFRYSAHAQDLNNLLDVHTGPYRLAPQKKNPHCFMEHHKIKQRSTNTKIRNTPNTWGPGSELPSTPMFISAYIIFLFTLNGCLDSERSTVFH